MSNEGRRPTSGMSLLRSPSRSVAWQHGQVARTTLPRLTDIAQGVMVRAEMTGELKAGGLFSAIRWLQRSLTLAQALGVLRLVYCGPSPGKPRTALSRSSL